MKAVEAELLRIDIVPNEAVSGLMMRPPQARACYVFAHGAGAGMTHTSMEMVAAGLGQRGIASLRYQFPYMEKGSKRPTARRRPRDRAGGGGGGGAAAAMRCR